MTIQEIFETIASRMIEGLMFHDEMSLYYHFLGLEGYKKCHDFHYLEESKNYKEINKYYINCYDKLLKTKTEFINIIPTKWYLYTRQDVDSSTKRTSVKTGMEKWLEWEKETLSIFLKMYKELIKLEEYLLADYIMCYIKKVKEELKEIKKKIIEFKTIDYDLIVIISEQKEIKNKYCHKIKKIF